MLTHLVGAGHEVKVASYDRGHANLSDDFDVFETEGLTLRSVDNKISVVKTFTDNVARLSDGVRKLRELRAQLFKEFQPDVVLTDFEPMTAYTARSFDLPLVTIDNQHRMRYMRYPLPDHLKKDALVTESVIRLMVPKPDVSLVTTFYFGELKNERTFLFPPILRREVLELQPTDGEHVLVYFTHGFESFHDNLRSLSRERFVIYGAGREGTEGNLTFRPFSSAGFLADLASARAVIATAGFTLMTEALHLGKPMLALPMKGQFEQELNALLLQDLACGRDGGEATLSTIEAFLYRLPEFRERCSGLPPHDGNQGIRDKLDELLANDCAEARAAHAGRSGARA
jgi:uncharacterized protein (TIGR00661 family)